MTTDHSHDATGLADTSRSGDALGAFSLEEFVVESVLELRDQFEQCFADAASKGAEALDDLTIEISAPWDLRDLAVAHLEVCDDPRLAAVSAFQVFRIPLSTEAPIDDLLTSLHAAFQPLEEDGYWLEVGIDFHLDGHASTRNPHQWAIPEAKLAQIRRGLAAFPADIWILLDEPIPTGGTIDSGAPVPGWVHVAVDTTAHIALVPVEEDDSSVADPSADVYLEVPVGSAVLDEIIALACDGTPLDDAVEALTGHRLLPG